MASAAEEETKPDNAMMKADETENRSSALRPSKRQHNNKYGNGNGIRAVSFSEDAPQKVENTTGDNSPNKTASPKRGSFFKRTRGMGKNNAKDISNTSEKENNNEQASANTHETGFANKTSSPRKWGSLRFKKGFSLFGSATGERWNGYGTLEDNNNIEENDAEAQTASEVDPVMKIYKNRNTQRVRFTLGGDSDILSGANGKSKGNSVTANNNSNAGNIKQFMSRALFGSKSGSGGTSSKKLSEEEMKREVREVGGGSLIWESATTPTGPEVIHTKSNLRKKSQHTTAPPELTVSFTEDPKARATVAKLLSKANKAEHSHFRYEYAVKCYLKALNILQKQAKYPDDHPTVVKTVGLMNNAHHVLSSYNNSANIVKIGIKNEDAGELVKALKMYTIAYRIRRDNLSRNHPSLVVLLNMLGSIQIKRGELKEAMQIYELALRNDQIDPDEIAKCDLQSDSFDFFRLQKEASVTDRNLLAKSVTFREMGTIYDMWGNAQEALKYYHKSLDCVAEWREKVKAHNVNRNITPKKNDEKVDSGSVSEEETKSESILQMDEGGISAKQNDSKHKYSIDNVKTISGAGDEEMELVIGLARECQKEGSSNLKSMNKYKRFFPKEMDSETKSGLDENSHADMDLSLTLHQIAQLYRAQGTFDMALDAYEVALRGMKMVLGKHHPNVAAVLGNIGNLQKEMGDLSAAYSTYQEVLGIEVYRLGLSHPDVAITLHNIATIDAARGNYKHSLILYKKVIGVQKKLFGEENLSVAVTAACMGDVYEKIGDLQKSMSSFDEAVRIKSALVGRHSLEVGRLLHKLGKLSFLTNEYLEAESFMARTLLIYRLQKLDENHEWFVEANRDSADIDGIIAVGAADQGEF